MDAVQVVMRQLQDELHQQRDDFKRLEATIAFFPTNAGARLEQVDDDVKKCQADMGIVRESIAREHSCAKAYADGLINTLSGQLRSIEQSMLEHCMAEPAKLTTYVDRAVDTLEADMIA